MENEEKAKNMIIVAIIDNYQNIINLINNYFNKL